MERSRPQPADVLRVCKTQVAKLELWLHRANVAFEPETLDTDMQQVVEEELAGCQVSQAGRSEGYLVTNLLPRWGNSLLKQQCASPTPF